MLRALPHCAMVVHPDWLSLEAIIFSLHPPSRILIPLRALARISLVPDPAILANAWTRLQLPTANPNESLDRCKGSADKAILLRHICCLRVKQRCAEPHVLSMPPHSVVTQHLELNKRFPLDDCVDKVNMREELLCIF